MKDFQYLAQKYIVRTYANRGLVLEKGKGMYLYDQNNVKYLDLMSNYGVNIFGHSHPVIIKALSSQLNRLVTLHGSFINQVRAEASEMLIKKCGENYESLYWSNSGAEAIEAALKFAVLTTGKKKFIACKHGYHGKTLGSLSATSGDKYRKPFEPLLWQFSHVEYNNLNDLEKNINSDIAAFVVEPVQGEGGIIVPNNSYLKKVREICQKKGALLIIDEIQSGCGRTGAFLASEKIGVSSDILCLGKGLAGGIPVGATVVSKEIALKIPKGIHTSTFGGNPLACAGVVSVLNLLDKKRLLHIEAMGEYFISLLRKIKSDNVVEVRGTGLMIGIEVRERRDDLLKRLQQNKVLAIPGGEGVVRFLPPFIIEKKEIKIAVSVLKEIL